MECGWTLLIMMTVNISVVLSLVSSELTNQGVQSPVDPLRAVTSQVQAPAHTALFLDATGSTGTMEHDPSSRSSRPGRLNKVLKRGNLLEDCVRKARLVYYRSQVSQDQPEFVRACEMMWQMISEKSADMKRSSPGKWAIWATRALRMNRFVNHQTYFIPRRLLYKVRIADEKRGKYLVRNADNDTNESHLEDQIQEPQNAIKTDHNESTKSNVKAKDSAIRFSSPFAIRGLKRKPSNAPRVRSKRSPWAGSENRYNVLDMLRTRLHARGKKRSRPVAAPTTAASRSRRPSLPHRRMLSAHHALRRLKRNTWYPDLAEIVQRHAANIARAPHVKKAQKPSDRHPFVGGIGDYAAEMALQTYAQLLKSELNNENTFGGASKTTRNARPFIG